MPNSDGSVIIDVSLNTKNIEDKFDKAGSHVKKVWSAASKSMADSVSDGAKKVTDTLNSMRSAFSTIAGALVTAFSIGSVIESGANVKAAKAQFEQTFADIEEDAKKSIGAIADECGIIDTRLQGVGTSIYAFAKTTGMESADALNLMNDALMVTADSAAYYDRSLEDTAESLKSFLKGNYENDAALGLSCTETTRNAKATELYGKKFQELSEAQKQVALLEMVKDANELSGALGQAAREADGWENVTGNLKESWKQLMAVVGTPILGAAVPLIQDLTGALEELSPMAKIAADSVSKAFGGEFSKLLDSLKLDLSFDPEQAEKQINKFVKDTKKAFSDFFKPFQNAWSKSGKSVIKGLDSSFKSIKKLIGTIADSFAKVWTNGSGEKIIGRIFDIFKNINSTIGNIADSLAKAWNDDNIGTTAVQNLADILDGLGGVIDKIIGKFSDLAKSVDFSALMGSLNGLADTFSPLAQAAENGIDLLFEEALKPLASWTVGEALPGFVDTITAALNALSDVWNAVSPVLKEQLWDGFLLPLGEWAGGAVTGALTAISDALNGIADSAGTVDLSFFTTLTDQLGEAFDGLDGSEKLSEFANGISSGFDDILAAAQPLKAYFTTDFIPALQTNISSLGQIFSGLFDTVSIVFSDIWNTVLLPFVSSLTSEALPMISDFITQANTTFSSLFGALKTAFDTAWTEGLAPLLESISTIWTDTVTMLKDKWDEFGAPIFDKLKGAIANTKTVFLELWESTLKPAFDSMKEMLDGIWTGHLKPLLDNFLSFMGELTSGLLDFYNSVLSPIIGFLVDKLSPVILDVVNFIKNIVESVIGSISGAINGIITTLRGVITFISGAFRGDWSKAWAGIRMVFKGIWDAFVNIVKTPINLIIDIINGFLGLVETALNGLIGGFEALINTIIDGLNSLSFDIPEEVANVIGISHIGFEIGYIDIGDLNIPEIPKLAKGTVVPANYGEFLAVLGDNKREAEVVAPESTIENAVARALANANFPQGQNGDIYIFLDSEQIAYSVERRAAAKSKRTGG